MKKLLIVLLAAFAISPFVLGTTIFQQKTEETVRESVPVLAEVLNAQSPTPAKFVAKPAKLVIPTLGVESEMEYVGLDDKGRMDVPKNDDNVAWWSLGVKPGETGNAVLAGHFDRKDGGPAVFYDLKDLNTGNDIEIVDEEGNKLTFEVYKKEIYKDATFPIELVFGATDEKNLNLITCDGVFDENAKNYSDRLVVFTRLKANSESGQI